VFGPGLAVVVADTGESMRVGIPASQTKWWAAGTDLGLNDLNVRKRRQPGKGRVKLSASLALALAFPVIVTIKLIKWADR
jgi:hypothetical protein